MELVVGDQASSNLDFPNILWDRLKSLMILSYNLKEEIIMLEKLTATVGIGAMMLLAGVNGVEVRALD